MWWNEKRDRKRPRELIVGYLLTLVIVPVLYSTVESAKTGLRAKLSRGPRVAPEITAA